MTTLSDSRPPHARSAAAAGLIRGAATGRFILQRCQDCSNVQYPPRDACHNCLGTELAWEDVDRQGLLSAKTTIQASNEPYFQKRLPWTVGIVASAEGPSIVAHLLPGCVAGEPVVMDLRLDAAGRGVVVAQPATTHLGSLAANSRPLEDDFFQDPKNKRLLVTDGCSTLGHFVIAGLLSRGVTTVTAGCPGSDGICPEHEQSDRVNWVRVATDYAWPSEEWYLAAQLPNPKGTGDGHAFDAVFDTTA
ncbi:zinc ribbon domain-containing protein [Arthrobacter sp. NtRootA1]|uniref:Zn-ribbon domain-containing OB-fold protein n=1 Tax=Arthrobacter sp. NtRootA1 TaxID=2830983 RepID=UPI001CC562FD|nr:zinc ribbon domain-containing protein [Arthrobacter sp. NtRootA1]BCW05749.1 hypothetical protein NtRootA1_18870 [Arthrobacter sp. NtRootA1]